MNNWFKINGLFNTNSLKDIEIYSNTIENRKFEDISQAELIKENNANLEMCKKYNQRYILVDDKYEIDFEL